VDFASEIRFDPGNPLGQDWRDLQDVELSIYRSEKMVHGEFVS
jgi:hypothetical protein